MPSPNYRDRLVTQAGMSPFSYCPGTVLASVADILWLTQYSDINPFPLFLTPSQRLEKIR